MDPLTAAAGTVAFEIVKLAAADPDVKRAVRERLRGDPERNAVARAVQAALRDLDATYPEWSASLFDDTFLKTAAAPLLARFLTRQGEVEPFELALAWSRYLGQASKKTTVARVRDAEPVAALFLSRFSSELLEQDELRDLSDARSIEQLRQSVGMLTAAITGGHATTGTKLDYLQWVYNRNLYLDIRGTLQTQRQVQLKLDEIYVALAARRELGHHLLDRRFRGEEFAELDQRLRAAGLSDEDVEAQLEALLSDEPELRAMPGFATVDLHELVTTEQRAVILGDPGSGKTTLLRYLALHYAQAALNNVRASATPSVIPLLLRIAAYAEGELLRTSSLTDALGPLLRQAECPAEAVQNLLERELASGNCLVLLDGLDEITQPDDRRRVVARIEDFVSRHAAAGNRFVVTSRIAGYRTYPLPSPFVHCSVEAMGRPQQELFLERWCHAVEAAGTPDLPAEDREVIAKREIQAITRALDESSGVARLATNPLMLRILALIHRTGARLPDKRIDLYKLAADTLARTWRLAQGVPESVLVRDEYLNRLLGSLAYWMHANKPTGIASQGEVSAQLASEYARLQGGNPADPGPEVEVQVNRFLTAVRIQTGLFVERAPRRYGFMHLTFEEYYAARHLVSRTGRAPALIRQHLHDPRWAETILLALGFKGLDFPDDASELVEAAVWPAQPSPLHRPHDPYEIDILGWDYLFAVNCAADHIPLDSGLLARLLDRCYQDLTASATGPARFAPYVTELRHAARKLIASGRADALLERLTGAARSTPDSLIGSRAMSTLAMLAYDLKPEVAELLDELSRSPDPLVRRHVAMAYGAVYVSLSEMNEQAIGTILRLINDEDSQTRAQALGVLRFQDLPEWAKDAALNALVADSELVQAAAALALAGYDGPDEEVHDRTLGLLNDPTVPKTGAVWAACLEGQANARKAGAARLDALAEVIRDVASPGRRTAGAALGYLAAEGEDAARFVLANQDLHQFINPEALSYVSHYRSRKDLEWVPKLIDEVLSTGTEAQRVLALHLTEAKLEPSDQNRLLRRGLTDAHTSVRAAAYGLLARTSEGPIVSELLNVLSTESEAPEVRAVILENINRAGMDDTKLVAQLSSIVEQGVRSSEPALMAAAGKRVLEMEGIDNQTKVSLALVLSLTSEKEPRLVGLELLGSLEDLTESAWDAVSTALEEDDLDLVECALFASRRHAGLRPRALGVVRRLLSSSENTSLSLYHQNRLWELFFYLNESYSDAAAEVIRASLSGPSDAALDVRDVAVRAAYEALKARPSDLLRAQELVGDALRVLVARDGTEGYLPHVFHTWLSTLTQQLVRAGA